MFKKSSLGLLAMAVSFVAMAATASASCLGVSRTINVSSFNAAMGANASAGIGLRHKEVVLTFDDGPMPGKTVSILNALSAECTKATFFMVGNMARAYPSLVQRVARAGHTVAHHTQAHSHLPGTSMARARAEIQNGVAMVNKALGPMRSRSSRLFRYPYLARNAALDRVLREHSLLPFSAYIDSTDWKPISSDAVVNRVMSLLNARGRGVILLHDIQSRTVSALPKLLDRLQAGGYKVVHVRTGRMGSPAMASLPPSKKARKKAISRKNVDRRITASIKPKSTRTRTVVTSSRSSKSEKRTSLIGRLFGNNSKDEVTKTNTRKKVSKRRASKAKAKPNKSMSWREKRRAESLARSKAKRKAAKAKVKRSAKKGETKKRRFSLFRNSIKRKPGESTASYHFRIKRARELANR
ncbi:polysaccharide deacetylase family protein [Pseudahrensia aquimaris]|uniref:Chitooligosaccharide deacetylase n=1 Tax=Pseudahrensia aquimaris TaxID=744461 RepID=A0ABW3FE63_9HYPH